MSVTARLDGVDVPQVKAQDVEFRFVVCMIHFYWPDNRPPAATLIRTVIGQIPEPGPVDNVVLRFTDDAAKPARLSVVINEENLPGYVGQSDH